MEFCVRRSESAKRDALGENIRLRVNAEFLIAIAANRGSRPPLPDDWPRIGGMEDDG